MFHSYPYYLPIYLFIFYFVFCIYFYSLLGSSLPAYCQLRLNLLPSFLLFAALATCHVLCQLCATSSLFCSFPLGLLFSSLVGSIFSTLWSVYSAVWSAQLSLLFSLELSNFIVTVEQKDTGL